jgi:hypothetical protein
MMSHGGPGHDTVSKAMPILSNIVFTFHQIGPVPSRGMSSVFLPKTPMSIVVIVP